MTAVFVRLLNMSITAGIIVLVVMLLRKILFKAPKFTHCLLWLIVGLRLVIPFSLESTLSLIPNNEPIISDVTVSVPNGNGQVSENIGKPQIDVPLSEVGESVGSSDMIMKICAVVWIIGVSLMLLYAVISYLKLLKNVRASLKLGKGRIYICDNISTPFILGVINPRVYLPSFIKRKEIKYVMAHERAHLKRNDHLWKPLAFLILSVYWFNPLIWLGYVLLCRDIELACDERVVKDLGEGDIFPYSETLLDLGVSRMRIAACPLAFGEVSIKSRVKNILNYKKPVFWIIIVSLVAGIVVGICFLTVRPDKNDDKNEEEKSEQTAEDTGEDDKHKHDYETEVLINATCAVQGEVLYKCKSCDRSYTEKVNTIEHTYESTVVKTATCAEGGEIKHNCNSCGYEYTEKTEPDENAHKFNYDAGKMLKFITCTESGTIEYTCTVCAGKKTESVAPAGHTWDLYSACCAHEGYAEFICRFCDTIKQERSGAPAHNWQNASCTKPEYCKDCSLTRGKAKGHTVYGGVCDRCKENIPKVVISAVKGFDLTINIGDSKIYFTNYHIEMSDDGFPEIWFTVSGTNTEYIHKIFYQVTITDASTGKVVHQGTSFTDAIPGEVREDCSPIYFYLPPGEYIYTISNHPEWNTVE